MMDPASPDRDSPRAYLRLGGATLAHHQLALALAAGCERIACLARALDPELIALQHEAERAGARFHMISGARALSGLVTASDELLVMAEGVVTAPSDVIPLVSQSPTVLVLSAEAAVPAGFERIDLNHAGAGIMLLPGRLVERLNDLPPDAEPVSALMRIALQAGVSQRLVPQAISNSGRWLLVRDEVQAHAAEDEWMDRQTAGLGHSPGLGIAAWLVRRYGTALLHAGSGARAAGLISLALLAMAGGAAWLGWPSVGLGLCAPAWLLQRAGGIIAGVQRDSLGIEQDLLARSVPFGWLVDFVIVSLLVVALPDVLGVPIWQKAFPAVALIGLMRLIPAIVGGSIGPWLEDRMLLSIGLAVFAGLGLLPFVLPGASLILIASGLAFVSKRKRIT
ncbi:MAG: hypothetical protein ACKOPO_04715 [Novosphingobium sp.]